MEYTEIALAVFTASGITYQAVRSYRDYRTPFLKKELPVNLILRAEKITEKLQCVVLVFDHHGCLIRKFPQAEWMYGKDRYKIKCAAPAGEYSFCVLLAGEVPGLSGILCREDAVRQFAATPGMLFVETGLQTVSRNASFELVVVQDETMEEPADISVCNLSELLPREVVTDAMAKELVLSLYPYRGEWTIGAVDYPGNQVGQWLSLRSRGRELILQLRTNFATCDRTATVQLHTAAGETFCLPVRQRMLGAHPTLTVSQHVFVTPGCKHEAVELTVTPDSDTSQWSIRKIETSDGGRWWNVYPQVGTPFTGVQKLRVHLEAKPANLVTRSAIVTLETGTYPFNQTTDVCLMQGECFNYYIEYPMDDVCARRADVIETPLNEKATLQYTIRVDSNQQWQVVAGDASWVEVGGVQPLPGLHGGIFTVQVASNAAHRVRNGIPAARCTTLTLINDTGIVKDILIYQGGYVRIRGILWLDRNLSVNGVLPEAAIPLGLGEEAVRRTWGAYYQFGKTTYQWDSATITSAYHWNSGTEETPGKRIGADPSPQGWRVPSRVELAALLNRLTSPVGDWLKGNGKEYLCLSSDDGIPFFLPLCGHLSHINGCRVLIPRGNKYWCGTSQSSIYGHSLCIEPSGQMSMEHDMKKYGFPVRCVLDTSVIS